MQFIKHRIPVVQFAALFLILAVVQTASAQENTEGEILGHATHRYRVVENWGKLDPEKVPVKDCHAMVEDSTGRILLLTNHTKNNVIIYDKDGKLLETWGTSWPGAHGMTLVEEDGREYLYITDHDLHKVFKTTLDGEVLVTLEYPEEGGKYPGNGNRYKPTDVAVLDSGDFFVTDGYGRFHVIKYAQPNKVLRLFGGTPELRQPHGVCIDGRDKENPVLLVASRGHESIKRYTLSGDFIDEIPMPGARVCDIVVNGSELYVPNLNGYISILNKDNKVISNLGGSMPLYDYEGTLQPMEKITDTFIHPHGLLVDNEGSIFVPQWNSGKTYPIKLERVK